MSSPQRNPTIRRAIGAVAFALAVPLTVAVATPATRSATAAPIGPPGPVVVSVDRSQVASVSNFSVGATHSQNSLNPWGDAESIARGRQVLSQAVSYQNQHIYGWGGTNPEVSPGVYNWVALDRRVQLMRDTGAEPVITLCCSPDWMNELGTETSTYQNLPPSFEHLDDFAELARRIALRYPDVTHFVVWNEMKGYWNSRASNWDYVAYTEMYNRVYDVLKATNPDIKVGGPYLVIEGTGTGDGGWFVDEPLTSRNELVIQYWLDHAHGLDFIALDRNVKDYHDGKVYTYDEILDLTRTFGDAARDVGALANVPVWYIEQHTTRGGGPLDYQAAAVASTLLEQMNAGVEVTFQWAPEQAQPNGLVEGSLFSSVHQSGGGYPYPAFESYRIFNQEFGPGTETFAAVSSDPRIKVAANADHTLVINQYEGPATVVVDGNSVQVAGWSVNLIDIAGNLLSAPEVVAPPSQPLQPTIEQRVDDKAASDEVVQFEDSPRSAPEAQSEAAAAAPTSSAVAAATTGPASQTFAEQVGTTQDDRLSSVVSHDDITYVAGQSYAALFGTHKGYGDAIIARKDVDGSTVWEQQFGSLYVQGIGGLAADSDGVVAVGASDVPIAGGQPDGGPGWDAFIRRYDTDGNVVWTSSIATSGNETATAVTLIDGFAYVVGHTDSPLDQSMPTGYQDGFVAKYSPTGQQLWIRTLSTAEADIATSVAPLGDGVVVVGSTSGPLGGPHVGLWDTFVVSVGADGAIRWSSQIGSPASDKASDVAVNARRVFVSGTAEGQLAGTDWIDGKDGFIVAYDLDGTEQDRAIFGTAAADNIDELAATTDGVFVLGSTRGSLAATNAGGYDVFSMELDDALEPLTPVEQWGSAGSDNATDVAVDLGRVVTVANTSGSWFAPAQGRADSAIIGFEPWGIVVTAESFAGTGDSWDGVHQWLESRPTDFTRDRGVGTMTVEPGRWTGTAFRQPATIDTRITAEMSVGELPIHKRLYLYLAGRSEGDGDYRVSIEIRPNGEVWVLPIARPGYYILLSPRINTGLVIAPGDTFNVELSITGQSTATIKGRVWAADQVRPDWQFSETDSSVVLMDSGGVGFTGDVQRPSPRPIAVTIDNLVVYEG